MATLGENTNGTTAEDDEDDRKLMYRVKAAKCYAYSTSSSQLAAKQWGAQRSTSDAGATISNDGKPGKPGKLLRENEGENSNKR